MHRKPHQIGKQVFEVEYFSDSNALTFRQEFTELIKRSLLATIEEVLDELDPKTAVLRLEKVEIELDLVSYPFDEWSIKNQLRKLLKEALDFRIIGIRHRQQKSINEGDALLINNKTEEELLIYFIQYGILPWWSSESNGYAVSVEALIQKLFRSDPKFISGILRKTGNSPGQIRRFLNHCPETVLVDFINSISDIPYERLKALKDSFQRVNIPAPIRNFDSVWKEFLVRYFVVEKRENRPLATLQRHFIEYLLHQNYIYTHQLAELFPEYFIFSWLKIHFYEKYKFLLETLKGAQMPMDASARFQTYRDILKTLLSSENDTQKVRNIISGSDELSNNAFLPEIEQRLETQHSFQIEAYENKKKAETYYNNIADKILKYLLYEMIAWEERIAGVSAIEAFILKLHQEHAESIRRLVTQIKWRYYPVVLDRIEKNFDKRTSEILFTHYFQKEAALKAFTSLEYRDKVLKIFFEKGIVPWEELIGNSIGQVETMIRAFYDQDPEYFKKALTTFLKPNPEYIDRIETLYSSDFTMFLKGLMEHTVPELMLVKNAEKRILEIPSDVDLIIYYLFYYEQYNVLPPELKVPLQTLVTFFIARYPEQAQIYFSLASYRNYTIIEQKFTPAVLSKINQWIFSENPETEQKNTHLNNKQNSPEASSPPEIKDPVYIINAGLVLIHPFLHRFFSLSGLLEKRKFKENESAHKAVHLMHYLVFKTEKPEEHQLTLNKILCGIPLSEPIDRKIELTEEDKETCESLIKGVIENWPILKKTSNQNFRVSLLQREGRLTKEEDTWRLKVEGRSYDMLLDRLPWSISMIKLAWMDKMLQVDWR